MKVLRGADSVGIGELTETLGVTATAVRQRVERLLQLGLIERQKVVAGRGRPIYQYRLTVNGYRQMGANATALAEAMWQEILAIEDEELRGRVIASIGSRLGREYAARLEAGDGQVSCEDRMKQLSEMLAQRQIENQVVQSGPLPVLDIGTCPYPSLTDASEDRAMCRLEEQMISEALGQPVHLSSCRLDGDSCCQFSTEASSASQTH
jgi:predicted ArsR family transcriptional regulator